MAREALLDGPRADLDGLRGVAAGDGELRAHALLHRPAEQAVHGQRRRLAGHVPQRHLDGGLGEVVADDGGLEVDAAASTAGDPCPAAPAPG